MPTVAYPKQYVEALYQEVADAKEKLDSGEVPVFDNIDMLVAYLEQNGSL